MTKKKKVLFLCTGNSCRSQMAEGWVNHLLKDRLEPFSAGIETHGMDSATMEVMHEAGVDLSAHRSQLLGDFDLHELDYIVTVCDHAHESCPIVPAGCLVIHKGFDDPPRLAEKCTSTEEKLDCYRRVRDEIKNYVERLPEILASEEKKHERCSWSN